MNLFNPKSGLLALIQVRTYFWPSDTECKESRDSSRKKNFFRSGTGLISFICQTFVPSIVFTKSTKFESELAITDPVTLFSQIISGNEVNLFRQSH